MKVTLKQSLNACEERVAWYKQFEGKYPKDLRSRQAIEAAKRWKKEPTEENKKAYTDAAYAYAYAAAYADTVDTAVYAQTGQGEIMKRCKDCKWYNKCIDRSLQPVSCIGYKRKWWRFWRPK